MNRNFMTAMMIASALLALRPVTFAGGIPDPPFTYQGMLKQRGAAFTGPADLEFRLLNGTGGGAMQIGPTLHFVAVPVTNGVFTVALDFDSGAFDGSTRALEIGVIAPSNGGVGPYSTLTPRQIVHAAPQALYAMNANTPFVFSGANAVFTGGNVGIGTTTPNAKLQVAGDMSLLADGFGLSLLGFSNNLLGRINRLGFANAGLTIADHGTGPIVLATSTSMGAAGERMRITPEGRVGIGTDSPISTLQVGGDLSLLADGFGLSLLGFSNNLLGRINRLGFAGSGLTIADHGTGPIVLATSTFMGAAGERMRITPDGNVGIGTDAPGAFRLAVNGTAANSSGSWSIFSDARLKTNVRDLPEGTLNRVLGLHGRNFEFTREARRNGRGEDDTQTGFIAQEVQTVFPEWVAENSDGYLFITERGTTALMVEALRDLRIEKDEQFKQVNQQLKGMSDAVVVQTGLIIEMREDISALKNENKELRSRIIALEKIVEGMLGGGGGGDPLPVDPGK